ncbi:TetR/AcrR family transcriptional regulator [Streptomyces canus]|uniref:TetR/AcrR family transcriptional regulator n=1 Tax=Streptomyces canus TaxID=58343 RepID=UPI00039B7E2D|nr:TetR/AcrR family transcriptional regulator [Streptomyces canus]
MTSSTPEQRSRPAPAPRADGTRLAIIECAERLYAERGVNGVSLREIGAAAGQRNTGAVRYHFGSKAGLLSAVFEHRMSPANTLRERMLAEADAEGRGMDPRTLVEALVLPLAELLGEPGRPSWYARFLAQTAADPVLANAVGYRPDSPWTSGAVKAEQRILRHLRRLPEHLRRQRFLLLVGFFTHALADWEAQLSTGHDHLTSRQQLVEHVITLGAAMLAVDSPQSEPHPG